MRTSYCDDTRHQLCKSVVDRYSAEDKPEDEHRGQTLLHFRTVTELYEKERYPVRYECIV